jgi:glycosyltransferase involved in cell wall biosynthesis
MRFAELGYTEIYNQFLYPENFVIRLTKKFTSPKLASGIKWFIPVRYQARIKDVLYFRNLQKSLLIPISCKVLLPESILDNPQVDYLVAFGESTNQIIIFFHDAFPITHPDLVSPETRSRATAIVSLMKVADMISCQTESVAKVFKALIEASSALESENLPLNVRVHRRPVIQLLSDDSAGKIHLRSEKALPMVLAIGTIEPRKDYSLLLLACENLWRKGIRFSLNIVGNWGWTTGEVSGLVNKLHKHKRPIAILSGLDNKELKILLREAQVFVYPSLSEGLGLPPGEAITYGLKPICRPLPSLVETYSQTDLIFFDGSVEDLSLKIEKELMSKSSLPEIKTEIVTWENMVGQLLADIDSM